MGHYGPYHIFEQELILSWNFGPLTKILLHMKVSKIGIQEDPLLSWQPFYDMLIFLILQVWRAISENDTWLLLKKLAIMLNNSLLSFRICKQKYKIRFGSKVINIQSKQVFWRKIGINNNDVIKKLYD